MKDKRNIPTKFYLALDENTRQAIMARYAENKGAFLQKCLNHLSEDNNKTYVIKGCYNGFYHIVPADPNTAYAKASYVIGIYTQEDN